MPGFGSGSVWSTVKKRGRNTHLIWSPPSTLLRHDEGDDVRHRRSFQLWSQRTFNMADGVRKRFTTEIDPSVVARPGRASPTSGGPATSRERGRKLGDPDHAALVCRGTRRQFGAAMFMRKGIADAADEICLLKSASKVQMACAMWSSLHLIR